MSDFLLTILGFGYFFYVAWVLISGRNPIIDWLIERRLALTPASDWALQRRATAQQCWETTEEVPEERRQFLEHMARELELTLRRSSRREQQSD